MDRLFPRFLLNRLKYIIYIESPPVPPDLVPGPGICARARVLFPVPGICSMFPGSGPWSRDLVLGPLVSKRGSKIVMMFVVMGAMMLFMLFVMTFV